MSTEVHKSTQCGWNNWTKMSSVLCDKRVPQHVKGKIHKIIVQPAMLYGMETMPVTISHVKKLAGSDRNEDVQMGMWPHTKITYEKR